MVRMAAGMGSSLLLALLLLLRYEVLDNNYFPWTALASCGILRHPEAASPASGYARLIIRLRVI